MRRRIRLWMARNVGRGHRRRVAVLGLVLGGSLLALPGVAGASPPGGSPTPTVPTSTPALTPASAGYRLLGGDGAAFSFSAPFLGSAASDPTSCPVILVDRDMPDGSCRSMATTPDGGGYWILNASTGVITAFGDATLHGDPAETRAGTSRAQLPTFIGITVTPDGNGYWVLELGLSGLGSVEGFGDAAVYGDEVMAAAGGAGHVGMPVALVSTADGAGYWIVDSDGGVFTFGDAAFRGSMGGVRLVAPVVGMAATPGGGGYWLVAADGGVFAFGDAAFSGSMGGTPLVAAVVGMAADPNGRGYWLAAADGGVFAFGAPFLGSMGGHPLNRPVFAVSASATAA